MPINNYKTTRLRRRPPANWRARIDKIENIYLRTVIARIVWWDYFSHRKVPERWPHLDIYKDSWLDVDGQTTPEHIFLELITLGYPRQIAQARARKSYYIDRNEHATAP